MVLRRTIENITKRKWFYPFVYIGLIIVSMLPPITEIPYDPQDAQNVVMHILMVSINPYHDWGWIFHLATLALAALIILKPEVAGRFVAAYFGVNYLVIAALQTNAVTEAYGFAVQTGALIGAGLIGLIWIVVGIRGNIQATYKDIPRWRWLLLPFALLVFWSPMSIQGDAVAPNFDLLLLLTCPDYGLTYCFMTPVFLFFLILFYPRVDDFAFRVTAFNALIYGVYNLTHWFNPGLVWMGVMHIPLLVMPLVALWLARQQRRGQLTAV